LLLRRLLRTSLVLILEVCLYKYKSGSSIIAVAVHLVINCIKATDS